MRLRTKIIKIGRSKGLIIPKALLEKAGLTENVELVAQKGQLIVRTAIGPRAGCAEAFARVADEEDDQVTDFRFFSNKWDETEWEW